MDETFGHLLTAASALAGLILVFLGQSVSAYDGFEADAQGAVRTKYQRRARLAFAGLMSALVSVAVALISIWWSPSCFLPIAVLGVAVAFALTALLAWLTLSDVR